MKRALIDPRGLIADVQPMGGDYPVAPPMYWASVPDDCQPYTWPWDAESGVASPAPPPPRTVADIERERDAACAANVTALGRTWQADARSVALLNGAVTLAQAGGPLPPVWRDADNDNMPVTSLSDLLAIAGAIATQVQAAYTASWAAKAELGE